MYYPLKDEFVNLAKDFNLIPVYKEIIADMDTPVSAFSKLGKSEYSFLLESVEGGEKIARYSFLGSDPYLIITARNGVVEISENGKISEEKVSDPLDIVEKFILRYKPASINGLSSFHGGAVGYVGYDAVKYFENVPETNIDDLNLPEMVFVFTDTILIFDHLKHKIKVVANAYIEGNADSAYEKAILRIDELVNKLCQSLKPRPLEEHPAGEIENLESNVSKENFIASVEKAKKYILAGDIFQVVLSQRFSTEIHCDPFDIYRVLRILNPSPYMGYLKYKDMTLIASSPELLVKLEGKRVELRPLAGTRRRGKDELEDEMLEKELMADEKERAEHIMLVDLGRNDLGRVCEAGTVKVDDLMFIEKYSHVMHIVSSVSGILRKDKNAFDVLRAAFPAGTVSGAPKIRAMEIINELEVNQRGPYAGVFGYFGFSGSFDTGITIRTIIISGNKAYVQAGAGIVADSISEREFSETVNKAKALLLAVNITQG
ncbi:MAG: anthranilate synthase component I [Actinobacteria bacterium]|nr:anthranilate synthase component I [Actinomycetota bacterium]